MLVSYRFETEKDGEGYMITFPDFSDALSYAYTIDEIPTQAQDCLETVLAYRYLENRPLPRPSRTGKDDLLVSPTIPTSMKLLVLWGIEDGKVKNRAALASMLKVSPVQIMRMLDPHKSTHVKHLDKALEIMGIRPSITVSDAKPSIRSGRGENRAAS